VWVNAVHDGVDLAVAAIALLLLWSGRAPPLAAVLLCALASMLRLAG